MTSQLRKCLRVLQRLNHMIAGSVCRGCHVKSGVFPSTPSRVTHAERVSGLRRPSAAFTATGLWTHPGQHPLVWLQRPQTLLKAFSARDGCLRKVFFSGKRGKGEEVLIAWCKTSSLCTHVGVVHGLSGPFVDQRRVLDTLQDTYSSLTQATAFSPSGEYCTEVSPHERD